MNEACEHKGMRIARTEIGSQIHRMEWCEDCGELLDDRSTPTPLPGSPEEAALVTKALDNRQDNDKLPAA